MDKEKKGSTEVHNCPECDAEGHCTLQPIEDFFRGNKAGKDQMGDELEKVVNNGWHDTLLTDAVCQSVGSPTHYVIQIAMETGYIIAKGAHIGPMSPDQSRKIHGLINSMKHMEEATSELPNKDRTG